MGVILSCQYKLTAVDEMRHTIISCYVKVVASCDGLVDFRKTKQSDEVSLILVIICKKFSANLMPLKETGYNKSGVNRDEAW